MGLYGSPDLEPSRADKKKEIKRVGKEGHKPQTNIWVWVVILTMNVLFLITVGIRSDSILTVLMLDSVIMFIISMISLIYNLIKKNKAKDDVIFVLSSIVLFFVFTVILGIIEGGK